MKRIIPILAAACILPTFVQAQIVSYDKVGIGINPPTIPLQIVPPTSTTYNQVNTFPFTLTFGTGKIGLGVDSNNAYIQTFNSKPLNINLDGNNTLLNANGIGWVGLGTSKPYFPLHVVTNTGVTGIGITSTAALNDVNGAFIRLYNAGFPTAADQRFGGILFGANPSGYDYRTAAYIEARSSGAWTENSSYPTYLRIMTVAKGKVGVEERLRINEEGNIAIPIGSHLGTVLATRFPYDGKFQPHYGLQWAFDSWTGTGPTLLASGYGGIKLFTNGASRLSINYDGNVGIGTDDTKGYKFAVNGDAIFTKIKIKAAGAWPDYVFADDYKLPELTTVKTFIKENKHLPGMPSAKEIKENDIDLGEMNRKLLEKVEELTLYLLKVTEENAQMKKDLEVLKAKVM
ncbi:hypothetical protein DVR12_01320 [Chitinophaga silvatica]|uniref:BZIP transcription factor n=1 Tax=Chitinophaga silvatica TaxID=2282649 RepID=A0A3E1YGG6_9BACT|nr:hypothetical protein [Chitinophaga silvatica]RFS26458.1 hypothetical protein DVR12_01320 [Chitinophaga silvatica]